MLKSPVVPQLTDSSFAAETATGLVAVDFSAEWCPPCRVMEPVVEAIARENASVVRVFQLDSDANPAAAARFGVRSLPTILFFRDGRLVDRVVGSVPRQTLQQRIDQLLAARVGGD
jgi:thioredoxin 1